MCMNEEQYLQCKMSLINFKQMKIIAVYTQLKQLRNKA